MRGALDLVLLAVVALDLWVVGSSRLAGCVRACAAQGVLLAALPLLLAGGAERSKLWWLLGSALAILAIKAVAIPLLLTRAIREARVVREVEPFVSLHGSLALASLLVALAFGLGAALPMPLSTPTRMLAPSAFATVFLGLLVTVVRRKAVTQVIGYLMLENGVFVFGQALGGAMPLVVDLGVLLDVLVGVFVMGIAIHQIRREFDHIDTGALSDLRG